jgi:hypothetical protein
MSQAPRSALLRRLLALYPRRWRDRYGEEMAGLLEDRRATPTLVADLLRGAADAHLHHAELLPESPGDALSRALGGLVQALVLTLVVVAGVTKASEDTGLAAGAATDVVRAGAGLALAGALALALPAALAAVAAAARPGPARRQVAAIAGAPVLFAAVTIGLGALAPRLGPATGHVAFWAWALCGAGAAGIAARAAASLVREHAPSGVLVRRWPAAWLTAAGGLLALAGVMAWGIDAGDRGVALGGLPGPVVAVAGTLACVAAAAALWRCVRTGQHARGALAARR